MAGNHTQNFHLSQWALSDDVRMEDFNADNAALEAALSGMAQLATGSYVGTGEYGAEHPCTLTFDSAPQAILITRCTTEISEWTYMIAIRGMDWGSMLFRLSNYLSSGLIPVTWGANSLTWYTGAAYMQMNDLNATYRYVALGLPAAQS